MKTTANPDKEIIKTILGFTEDITSCDCCGKTDLKGTYAIDFNGDICYYGSVCAFKVQGITFEEQKQVKKEYNKKIKAIDKLKEMEANFNGTDYSLVKMLRFVEEKKLDINSFVLKYGKIVDENNYYTAYSIGHVTKIINK